jgi:hypothetical protein
MASEKQIAKWKDEAEKINSNPKYIQTYVEYRTKAKKADQRLVRLEALAYEEHFENVLEFAYKGAIRDIQSWKKHGQVGGDRRFNTAPPTKLTELEAKIADIDKFLLKSTSSKSGIVKSYKKRANTFNKRYGKLYGVEFTWEDIAIYYEDKKGQREAVKLASKTEVRALAVLKKMTDKKLAKEIGDSNERVQKITGSDKILAKEINRLMEQGLDYNKLMGGN